MKNKVILSLILFISTLSTTYAREGSIPPTEALNRLIEGNKHYMSGDFVNDIDHRKELEVDFNIHRPFATILGCSDARVPPEIVFDEGIGTLFIVRDAGNVLGEIQYDSLDFATFGLGSTLIVVMGHQNCGAVRAVLKGEAQSIPHVAALIEPAVKAVKNMAGDPLENAVKSNVKMTVEKLKATERYAKQIEKNALMIVGAYYHFDTGQVEFLK